MTHAYWRMTGLACLAALFMIPAIGLAEDKAPPYVLEWSHFSFSSHVQLDSGHVNTHVNLNGQFVLKDEKVDFAAVSRQITFTDIIDQDENNILDEDNQIPDPKPTGRTGRVTSHVHHGSDNRNYEFIERSDSSSSRGSRRKSIFIHGSMSGIKALPQRVKAVAGYVYALKIKKTQTLDIPFTQAGKPVEFKEGGVTYTLDELDQKGTQLRFKLEFDSTKGHPMRPESSDAPFVSRVSLVDDKGKEIDVRNSGSSWSSSGMAVKGSMNHYATVKADSVPVKLRLHYVTEFDEQKLHFELEF